MGLPMVNIAFKNTAIAAISSGSSGTLVLIMKDASVATGLTEYKLTSVTEIPSTLSATNQDLAELAFVGVPKEMKLIVIPEAAANYTAALNYLETIKFNVVAVPGIATSDVSVVASAIKSLYDTKQRKITAVLPDSASDHPSIVNYATDNNVVGSTTYSTSEFTARIAGLIAGLDLSVAPTFQVLSDVTDVPKMSKADLDTAIDAGKFVIYHDGEKVKVARGVTSFVTTTSDMGADWKKIKIVRILNKTYEDVKKTAEDKYIGKVSGSYINKTLLINAINAYYEVLEQADILDVGKNLASIDVTAQKTYLKTILPTDVVDAMTDQQIKEANTRDQVFLTSTLRPLDAMEDIALKIFL